MAMRKLAEAFPHGGDCSGLVVIYEQCVRTFWHEDRYKDDLRYLKAGGIMIVSLLAQKATLATNVVKSLLHLVADIAMAEAKDNSDLQWLRMSFMTLISVVQLQSVQSITKKTVSVLNEIRDVLEILSGLTKDFNIDKFLAVFLDSLLEHSATDDQCSHTLLSIIETVPMKDYVSRVVVRLLSIRINISQGKINLVSSESGSQGKQILVSICEKYPNESREAFFGFLKAEIRRSAVLDLDVANILREKTAGSKKFDAIQDALIRRLCDDDLNVVLAVLNLKNLSELLNSPLLMKALQNNLDLARISTVNMKIITKLAETFSSSPEEYMSWLVKCCNSNELSKTLFFLILLKYVKMLKMGVGRFSEILDSCFPILKNEWEMLESLGISAERSKRRIVDGDCKGVLKDLHDTDVKDLNSEILACLFLRFLEAFIETAPDDVASVGYAGEVGDHTSDVFKKHQKCLLTKGKTSPAQIMLKLFTDKGVPYAAQIESLRSFSNV
ncbi:uncharacterized protein at3g06530 [Phtheirospermum japonicum]|uniref:Uncharacterized protein at3g06530 n=1 Tax=Phtheirospermum japonicum TaxID=374723 RepID=A0A830AZM9_9LAMI|nr:uncharacterized protein at3g06530 [Phtheirospermum japonicum]